MLLDIVNIGVNPNRTLVDIGHLLRALALYFQINTSHSERTENENN